MFPGHNRRINDFALQDKVESLSRRPWTPPELPISSSFLQFFPPAMETFPNSFQTPPSLRGSFESWYTQRPSLQQAPIGPVNDQFNPLRASSLYTTSRIPCDMRGDMFRNSSHRYFPFSPLDPSPLTNGVSAFRTVPTSITITPSRQPKASLNHIHTSSTDKNIPGGFVNPANLPLTPAPEIPLLNRDRLIRSAAPLQRICALLHGHCISCKRDGCQFGMDCARLKELLKHISQCNPREPCSIPSCLPLQTMISHFRNCQNPQCANCCQIHRLIKELNQGQIRQEAVSHNEAAFASTFQNGMTGSNLLTRYPPLHGNGSYEDPSFKPRLDPEFGSDLFLTYPNDKLNRSAAYPGGNIFISPSSQPPTGDLQFDSTFAEMVPNPGYDFRRTSNFAEMDMKNSVLQQASVKQELGSVNSTSTSFQLGTSLFETFTPEGIEEYLKAIRGPSGYHLLKPDIYQKDKRCAVCLNGEQTLQPIQLYCDCCLSRIKRGGMYWKPKPEIKLQFCACHKCFTGKKSQNFHIEQLNLSKGSFRSCKNDECVTETWVACDKCGYWVHSSCGLFNRGENNEKAKYMCPFCLKEEMEIGIRPIPTEKPPSMWGAEKLKESLLSKYIQSKLETKVNLELEHLGSSLSTGCGLFVRVLMSMKKATQVQPMMSQAFPNSPKQFPYRQRVIGVFQKIHGCDVLLFCMYVQEYGKDCPKPNQKWINLEYIDSVRHFTPDIKTQKGESLRSLVYQEVILSYIEFVKRYGFEVFYIWACPPSKEGEDYILHCKPPNQKMPSAERLRLWYKDLLKLAKQRKIVTYGSNLMDTFFTNGGDRISNESFCLTELPYFEGDYWPTEAEKLLKSFQTTRPETKKKSLGKRKTRGEASLDECLENGLMASLKFPRWSDFMVWHLQEPCSVCRQYIMTGFKYAYNHENGKGCNESVKKKAHFEGIKLGREGPISNSHFFQLCENCYQLYQSVGGAGESIPDSIQLEDLERTEVNTNSRKFPSIKTSQDGEVEGEKEEDEEEELKSEMEVDIFSEIFESRQSFLAFCKGNHYQFDTLQHAKHTTMMLLYHLHNAEAPVFPVICSSCGMELPMHEVKNLKNTESVLCSVCKANGILVRQGMPPRADLRSVVLTPHQHGHDTGSQHAREFEAFQHASRCIERYCRHPRCEEIKEVFRHVSNCKIGRSGSCNACRFFDWFAKRHGHSCQGDCFVPYCDRYRALAHQQMRFDQAQRRRGYSVDNSKSSSSS